MDQFLQTVSNQRTDEYGGSVENRVRFPLEALKAIVEAVGAERTAVRISPWATFQGEEYTLSSFFRISNSASIDMGMKNPLPTFTTFIECIRDTHPNLAYIHVVEPLADGGRDVDLTNEDQAQSNLALRKIWGDRPYIAAGGMDRTTAINTVEKYGGLVAFGRHFISNVSRVFSSQRSHFSDHIAARSTIAPEGRPPSDAL